MGLGTRSAIPHPRRSQIAPEEWFTRLTIPVYGTEDWMSRASTGCRRAAQPKMTTAVAPYFIFFLSGFAALLFIGLVLNNVFNPAAAVFQRADQSDYTTVGAVAGRVNE